MKQNNFIMKDSTNEVVGKYESPMIQVEEIVVENGFAQTSSGAPPIIGAKSAESPESW